jgi:hypothetical protein
MTTLGARCLVMLLGLLAHVGTAHAQGAPRIACSACHCRSDCWDANALMLDLLPRWDSPSS